MRPLLGNGGPLLRWRGQGFCSRRNRVKATVARSLYRAPASAGRCRRCWCAPYICSKLSTWHRLDCPSGPLDTHASTSSTQLLLYGAVYSIVGNDIWHWPLGGSQECLKQPTMKQTSPTPSPIRSPPRASSFANAIPVCLPPGVCSLLEQLSYQTTGYAALLVCHPSETAHTAGPGKLQWYP